MISKRRSTCGFPGLWHVRTSCPVSDRESLSSRMSRPAVRQITAWLVSELGRWKEECMRAIAAHFESVCAKAGITVDELAQALGEFHYEIVEACAFEDF